jgi:hypothetical protein
VPGRDVFPWGGADAVANGGRGFQISAAALYEEYTAFAASRVGLHAGEVVMTQKALGVAMTRAATASKGAIGREANKRLPGTKPGTWYTVRPSMLRMWLSKSYGMGDEGDIGDGGDGGHGQQ